MSVYCLKDGRWVVEYRNRNAPPAKIREYFGRDPEDELKARARNEELNLGPYTRRTPGEHETKFEELADAYLKAKLGTMQDTTMDRLMIKLKKVILPELGHCGVYRVTRERMDQYKVKRLKAGVTRSTVHSEITYVHAILNWAFQERYLTQNPLAGYKKPKRDDAIIRPPSKEEVDNLLAVAPPHLVRALALSYFTGIRPGREELLKVQWSHVHWDLQLIIVESAKKNGPPSRMVPIHDSFLPILKSWHLADLEEERRIRKKRSLESGMKKGDQKEHDSYIIQWRGRPIKRLNKGFASAKTLAGITRRLPPYSFRHAFATNVLASGGDLKATSLMMGHSRPDTTMRVYQHVSMDLQRQSVNKMPAIEVPAAILKGQVDRTIVPPSQQLH